MKITLLLTLFLSFNSFAQIAKVDVQLFPAGSFEAKGKVVGSLKKSKGVLVGKNIKVPVKGLKTGIELRDNHLHKRLMPKKHPNIVMLKAKAKGGKGVGLISVNGIKKKVKFSYDMKGRKAVCKFKLNLKDFKIKDIMYMGVGVEDEVSIVAEVPVS